MDEDWDSMSEIDSEDEFVAEMGAFDRVGAGGGLLGGKLSKLEKALQDPLERFQSQIDAICRSINGLETKIKISQHEIDQMISYAHKLEYIQYKNATAYILGYMVLTKKNIDKQKFQTVTKILGKLDDDSIKPPDIIRYGRMWITTVL